MSPAPGTANLRALDTQAVVLEKLDGVRANTLVETGPTASGVELCSGREQLVAARPTCIQTCSVLVEERSRPRPFCRRLTKDGIRLSTEFRAPLGIVVLNLVSHVALGVQASIGRVERLIQPCMAERSPVIRAERSSRRDRSASLNSTSAAAAFSSR